MKPRTDTIHHLNDVTWVHPLFTNIPFSFRLFHFQITSEFMVIIHWTASGRVAGGLHSVTSLLLMSNLALWH